MFVAVVDICEAELRDDRHEKEKNTKRKKESREHAHTPTSASCGCATCRRLQRSHGRRQRHFCTSI
jgi:hypothetical protein